jgi:translocation and assembly module TamB
MTSPSLETASESKQRETEDLVSEKDATKKSPTKKQKKQTRKGFFRFIFLSLIILFAALVWLFGTESGARSTLQFVSQLTNNRVQFIGVSGRLIDDLTLQEIQYEDQENYLKAYQVQLDWSPHFLLMGKLHIKQLNMLSLELSSKPSDEIIRLPEEIHSPIAIDISQWAIGRMKILPWKSTEQNRAQHDVELELRALVGQLKITRDSHHLISQFISDWGKLQLDASVATQKPFALAAKWTYQGQVVKNIPLAQAQGSVSGNLQTILIEGKASSGDHQQVWKAANLKQQDLLAEQQLSGSFKLKIQPFQSNFLQQLFIDVRHLNPANLHAQAPRARLNIQANLHPSDSKKTNTTFSPWDLKGVLSIENAAPAPLDLTGIPIHHFKTQISLTTQEIVLSDMQIKLRNQGDVRGQARIKLQGKTLPIIDAQVNVSNVNLAHLMTPLRSTKIAGKIQVQTKNDQAIYFQTQLSDARAKLDVQAKYSAHPKSREHSLTLSTINLQSGGGQVTGSGVLQFGRATVFEINAQVRRFDPAFWWSMPSAQMNADFFMKGSSAPKLNWILDLSRFDADYRGQTMTGVAQISLLPDTSLEVKKLELLSGKNSLSATGVWGRENEQLNLVLDAPYLNNFSDLLNRSLQGSAKVHAQLQGSLAEPYGKIDVLAQDISFDKKVSLVHLHAKLDIGKGVQGDLIFNAQAQQLRLSSPLKATSANLKNQADQLIKVVEDVSITFGGKKHQHTIDANIAFADRSRISLSAQGNVNVTAASNASWSGQVTSLKLQGVQEIQLREAWSMRFSSQEVVLGPAVLQGSLGSLRLDKLDWKPGRFLTKGKLNDLVALEIFNKFHPQDRFDGDLKVQGAWDIALTEGLFGQVELKRQSGDVRVLDADGTAKPQNLGMQEVEARLSMGGLVPGSDAENIHLNLRAKGQRFGLWTANLKTQLSKTLNSWALKSDAPVHGNISMEVGDLQWLSYQFNPELSVKGKMASQFQVQGSLGSPEYKGSIEGNELEVAFASEGLILPNGILRADIDTGKLNLKQLQFSNVVTLMPKHAHLEALKWIGKRGEFNASGQVDWIAQTGNIQAQWDAFPLLQRKDRWLVVSGQFKIAQADLAWALTGKMTANAAYFKLPKLPPPSLSSDVVLNRGFKLESEELDSQNEKKGMKTKLDVVLDMGSNFVFEGRGLNTLLAGSLRLRATDSSALTGHGSIQANGGAYEGYGQQLEIERGILNFNGSVTNPNLNIRALRKGLAVEAGVDVFGTVAQPQARLVSEPNVPDAEKLSWLVLGRDSEQSSSNDASLLLSAAGALLGGDSGSSLPRTIVQGLGFDEFFIGPAETGGGSKLPSQTVAGSTAINTNSSDKVISIGKRIRPGLVLSVERGLSDANGALKMSWQASKRVRIIGRSGTERSLDAKYIFSFD